jgi:hypothetical protein
MNEKSKEYKDFKGKKQKEMTVLVIYTFHEPGPLPEKFIENAIFKDEYVDFLVVYNHPSEKIPYKLPKYVKKLYRKNIGYDFGAWSYGLEHDKNYEKYDYYIFANASVEGPFLPPNAFFTKWTDYYVNGIKENIYLFGSTINCSAIKTEIDPSKYAHVQSYVFCLNRKAVKYLRECKIFDLEHFTENLKDTINQKEVAMSRKIIEKGWNIGCLHKYYRGTNFIDLSKNTINFQYLGDVMGLCHMNTLWTKEELIFVKGNRKVERTDG